MHDIAAGIIIYYRIRDITAPGFYFSIWIFGWGSIQKIPQKVGVYSRKTPKTGLFTKPGALIKSGAALERIWYMTEFDTFGLPAPRLHLK